MVENKVIFYSAAVLLFMLIELVLPNFTRLKLPPKRKYFMQDILFLILNMALAGTVAFYCIKFIFFGRNEWGLFLGSSYIKSLSWSWQFVMAFFIRDFLAYLMHRFAHTRIFWRFHVAHHESDYLDALASFRVHPINFLLNAVRAPILLLFGFSFSLLPVLGVLQFVHNLFVHANIKMDFGIFNFVVISPYLHRIHHSNDRNHYSSNYGVYLSIWDQMFGTFVNTKALDLDLGLKGHQRKSFMLSNLEPFTPRRSQKNSSN